MKNVNRGLPEMIAETTEKPQAKKVGEDIVRLADGTPDLRDAATRKIIFGTSSHQTGDR